MNIDQVHKALQDEGVNLFGPTEPEERLVAVLTERMPVRRAWVLLRERLNTAEAMIADETSKEIRGIVSNEIDGILRQAQPIYIKLNLLSKKALDLVVQCDKPLRDDLRDGFPDDLRAQVDAEYLL